MPRPIIKPFIAINLVDADAAEYQVIIIASHDHIFPRPARRRVVARSGVEVIVPRAAVEIVHITAAKQPIAIIPALQQIAAIGERPRERSPVGPAQ